MKMNKKLIALIAVVIIAAAAVCLVSFTGKDEPAVTEPSDGQPITVNLEPETTKEPLFKPNYDSKITVTLPIEVVDKRYGDDLEAFAEDKGYFSIEKKGDSHVKIKMREYSYRLLLTSVGMETVSGIGYAMDSGDYPFAVRMAKYNEDFSDIVFTVDREAYEKAENREDFFNTVALYCLYYQEYCQDSEDKCKITVCEKDTNIFIETVEISGGDIK